MSPKNVINADSEKQHAFDAHISLKLFAGVLGAVLLNGIAPVAVSGQQWFLMARHGECVEIDKLKRRVPDLGGINDPYSFVKLMQQKGYTVSSAEISETKGKAIEVKVPEKELFLVFVTSELCQNSGAK